MRLKFRVLVLGVIATAFLGCIGDDAEEDEVKSPLPFQTVGEYLAVEQGEEYRPVFIRGANLGVAVPGTRAGELAATYDDYRRWFEQMSDAGLNTVRIYTLHYPRFYRALRDHNEAHPDDPLYVMHGIWLREENPTRDLLTLTDEFDASIEEVVDCAHGDCSIDHRFGQAYGEYEVDISKWIMGWIIGREVHPDEVKTTNELHSELQGFDGEIFSVDDGEAVEAWFAERLELLVDHERQRHGAQRPVSVSTWPSLDPIEHPIENPAYSSEDIASFDMSQIDAVDAPGGVFATYHAYPYYPDYIVEDPDYRQFFDEQGPNSYMGYLTRLESYYDIPLFIGEFGVPSSWGNAHWGYTDMNHGGHDEKEQGEVSARLLRTIYETGCAGGAVFAWIDEWWKPTWITDPFDFPVERRPLWHNIVAPEQNFGFVGYDLGPPEYKQAPGLEMQAPIGAIEMAADAAFFHLRLHGTELPETSMVIGFDTYGDDRGESILPGGIQPDRRSEFALVIDGADSAELYVTTAYDLLGISLGTSEEEQLYHSIATDGEPWHLVRWQNGQSRESPDGETSFAPTYHDIGVLRIRSSEDPSSSHDAVVVGEDRIDIHLPWSLLHVVDPSQRHVMHGDRNQPGRQSTTTDGIAVSVAVDDTPVATTQRFDWPQWDEAPPTTERIKDSMQPFADAVDQMPYWLD